MSFFQPNRHYTRVSAIEPSLDILQEGFTHLLLDIDNTLLPRDTKIMPSDVLDWIELVKSLNIKVCLLSNNWHSEILEVAKSLDLPIVTHAVKPLPFAFLRARHIIGAKRKSTLVIGDQLFTDVLGAHFLAMKA